VKATTSRGKGSVFHPKPEQANGDGPITACMISVLAAATAAQFTS
jgi:hypothetical protein